MPGRCNADSRQMRLPLLVQGDDVIVWQPLPPALRKLERQPSEAGQDAAPVSVSALQAAASLTLTVALQTAKAL